MVAKLCSLETRFVSGYVIVNTLHRGE